MEYQTDKSVGNTDEQTEAGDQTDTAAAADDETKLTETPVAERQSNMQISPQMKESIQSTIMAANFGNITTVMMQSKNHRHMNLAQLQSLVVPPILKKQFRLVEAHKKDSGFTIPVAVALWAHVSEEVDKRLTENLDKPIDLAPDEWTSGNITWFVEVIGEQRFVGPMLRELCGSTLKDKPIKFRSIGKDGKVKISALNVQETQAEEKPVAKKQTSKKRTKKSKAKSTQTA